MLSLSLALLLSILVRVVPVVSSTSILLLPKEQQQRQDQKQHRQKYECFNSTIELKNAIQQYLQPGIASNPYSTIAIRYGWPINEWCVSKITDFSYLFTSSSSVSWSTPNHNENNNNDEVVPAVLIESFNYNISKWDMSNATNLTGMFENVYLFNYDISMWNINIQNNNVVVMDRMFYNASSFNTNLCSWYQKLQYKMYTTTSATINSNSPTITISMKDMFQYSGCSNQNDPSFIQSSTISNSTTKIRPFCHTCTIPRTTTNTMKLLPTTTGSTKTTTTTSRTLFDYNTSNYNNNSNICFQSRIELELAVTDYMINNSPTTDVAAQYGWPINVWCVTNITDFSFLFSPINNIQKSSFNEDISKWDMSNAITVEQMFSNNIIFNQNISTWKFSLSLNNTYRMFYNTKSFNYNLCSWGSTGIIGNPFQQQQSSSYINVTQMFRYTSCPNTLDPMYDNSTMSHPNPFCYDCITTGSGNINNLTSPPLSSSSSLSPIIPGIQQPQQPTQPQVSSISPSQVPITQQQPSNQQQQFVPTSITIPSPSLSSIGMNQTTPTVPPIPTVTTTTTAPIAINGNSTTLIPIATTNETVPTQTTTATTTTPIVSSTSTPNSSSSSSTSSIYGIQLYATQHSFHLYGLLLALSLIYYL